MGQWGSSGMLWGGGVAEAVYPGYHLILGGVGLLVAPGGYERRLGQQYAAKLSTARLSQSDRINDQALILDSWEGGEGYLRHETDTPDRYRRGGGIDATSDAGAVGLGPRMTAPAGLQLAWDTVTALHVFRGALYLGKSDGKVYSWNGTSLTLVGDTGKAGGVISFMTGGVPANEQDLYIGNGTDGAVWRYSPRLGGTFAANFTVSASSGFSITGVPALCEHTQEGIHYGYYGANQSQYALVGTIANTSGSTVEANALKLMEPNVGLLIEYDRSLIAIGNDTTDPHWRMYVGDASATIGWEDQPPVFGGYITAGCVFEGKLYLGESSGGRIWRWHGDKLSLVRELGTDAVPYTAAITGMAAWRGGLWISLIHTDGTPGLLRYDGNKTWTRPVIGLTGTTTGKLAVYNSQLHYATHATGAAKVFRTDGTFVGSGNVESGLINANLTGTDKLWVGIKVNHSALVSPQTVEVQYQLEDTGSWVSLGTSSTVGATSAEFDFPSAITAEQIAFKTILTGTAGSSTQLKVYSLVGRYKPAPGAKREWSLTVELAGTTAKKMTLADGTSLETRTGEEISAELWALVDAVAPVNLVDLDRSEYTVRVEEYREDIGGRWPNVDPLDRGWNLKGSLRLTEV